MKEDVHERAERLIGAAHIEGISTSEQAWLEAHLDACGACSEIANATQRSLRSLRSVAVRIDPGLIAATRFNVRLRARQLREGGARLLPLWISCALSFASGVVSTPLLWRGTEWLARYLALPNFAWLLAVFLLWVFPTAAVAAVFMVVGGQPAD